MEDNPYIVSPKTGGYTWPTKAEGEILVKNKVTNETNELLWKDQQDGPYMLEDLPGLEGGLETVAQVLFGESKDKILLDAKEAWEPYIANGKEARKIIISGGTESISVRQIELDVIQATGNGIGINAAIASRELALANPGDIAFGNSDAWRQVAQTRPDVETHAIGKGLLNYNSHKWLYKALECVGEEEPSDKDIQIIVNELAQNPETVLQVYITDEETSMLLLYLRDKVNKVREASGLEPIDKLNVDANSAEITKKLANKGYLYPTPEAAGEIQVEEDTYESWLEAEGKLSPIEIEMGEETPRMPGYSIVWDPDYEVFKQRVALGLSLLKDRWGSEKNYCKPVRGSDGKGAFPVYPNGGYDVDKIAREMHSKGHSWVIESFVNYRTMELKGKGIDQVRNVAPSVHVRGGNGYDTKLVQIFITEEDENGEIKETTEWGGHVYAPRDYIRNNGHNGDRILGMTQEEYDTGIDTIKKMAEYYGPEGFSRGGIDMAIGTIQTRWGEKKVNALQDMNIRTNGGDTARGFGKIVERMYGKEMPFATLVIKPNIGIDYQDVDNALSVIAEELNLNREDIRLLTAVAPGWGMFGIVGESPEKAFIEGLRIEKELKLRGIVS
ncbi:hypothetical protein GF362_06470 [Candidatus Dojkabacteria bacterium]|nr:hypothetical protein [Candidatus Dojkabacteria bacterium]